MERPLNKFFAVLAYLEVKAHILVALDKKRSWKVKHLN
jgi:hypothetical protein